jgi:adenylosuccinate synthase
MRATAVIGLGWGDEGKGTIVDALAHKLNAKLVVRFSGGAQAAHHVVTNDSRVHCFAQFGAGTFSGAYTHLSRFMMIDAGAIANEAEHLFELGIVDPLNLLTIDPDAPLLTPYHAAMNQLRELSRGNARHGSCGRGIGELASDIKTGDVDILTARDFWRGNYGPQPGTKRAVGRIRDRFIAQAEALPLDRNNHLPLFERLEQHPSKWLPRAQERTHGIQLAQTQYVLKGTESVIFEGSQGVLLDEKHGFQPHTTWSNVTFDNAITLLQEAGIKDGLQRIGVLRSYMTRHGAGPFPTENTAMQYLLKNDHNTESQWQGSMRTGHFDMVLAKYAIQACAGIDYLAITHIDKIVEPSAPELWSVATSYEYDDKLTVTSSINHEDVDTSDGFIELLDNRLAPVGMVSWGPTLADKVYLRRMGMSDNVPLASEDALRRMHNTNAQLWNP